MHRAKTSRNSTKAPATVPNATPKASKGQLGTWGSKASKAKLHARQCRLQLARNNPPSPLSSLDLFPSPTFSSSLARASSRLRSSSLTFPYLRFLFLPFFLSRSLHFPCFGQETTTEAPRVGCFFLCVREKENSEGKRRTKCFNRGRACACWLDGRSARWRSPMPPTLMSRPFQYVHEYLTYNKDRCRLTE